MNENRPERPYLQFQNQMSRLETVLLLLYLPIHAFLMPTILGFLFQRAGISYSMMQLNVCYYALSTVIVFLVARRFLRRSFDVLCDRLWGVLFTVVIAYFLQQALMYLVAILELPLGISGDNQNNAAVQEMQKADTVNVSEYAAEDMAAEEGSKDKMLIKENLKDVQTILLE